MRNKQTQGLLGQMNKRTTVRNKTKMSSRSLSDSVTIRNTATVGSVTTDASGNVDNTVLIQPAYAGNGPLTNVARCYQEYKGTDLTFRWQPNIGFTQSGTVWIGYIDNPEMIYRWNGYGSDRYTIIKSLPNVKSGHVFDAIEVHAKAPLRRKWFSLDQSVAATAADYDRTVQGMWVYLVNSAPASTVVANIMTSETHHLRGLINPLAVTTYATGAAGEPHRMPPPVPLPAPVPRPPKPDDPDEGSSS